MLSEIRSFLWDIWDNWYSLMTGVVGMILWAVSAAFDIDSLPARITFLTAGGTCLLIASFIAWRKEYKRACDKETRHNIGTALAAYSQKGQTLKADIQRSNDSISTHVFMEQKIAWTDEVRDYLRTNVSPGKAEYFYNGPSVAIAGVGGMNSDQTRQAKSMVFLSIDAHLSRLGEIMREY